MHAPPSPPFPRLQGTQGLPKSRWVKWLGRLEQVVEYFRPRDKPEWMTEAQWALIPQSIHVRELRYDIKTPGCRTRSIILVTTLLDSTRYSPADLAPLYAKRWEVETNLRHLKGPLGIDVLRTKTVAGIQKYSLSSRSPTTSFGWSCSKRLKFKALQPIASASLMPSDGCDAPPTSARFATSELSRDASVGIVLVSVSEGPRTARS
jgi:hypothetical protein